MPFRQARTEEFELMMKNASAVAPVSANAHLERSLTVPRMLEVIDYIKSDKPVYALVAPAAEDNLA